MTNVLGTPEKVELRARLFEIGIETLRKQGWKVEKRKGFGSSVRFISKGGKTQSISIRTSQDKWIAFPRNEQDSGWGTLSGVDFVLAVSVDDRHNPKFAKVHMIGAKEMLDRFDRAYAARRAAGYTIPLGRGLWLPLYYADEKDPVTHVGGGAGLLHPPIAQVPLDPAAPESNEPKKGSGDDCLLTIAEAKRRLAMTLGVDPSNIKITVEA
jgi:hypothetical protein